MSENNDFETQRDRDRRELTERFANQRQTRTGAINELSALLDAEDERVRTWQYTDGEWAGSDELNEGELIHDEGATQ